MLLCRDAWPTVTVQFKDVHFWGVRFTMRRLLHLLDEVGGEMGGLSLVTSPVGGQHGKVAGHLGGGARISIAYSGP